MAFGRHPAPRRAILLVLLYVAQCYNAHCPLPDSTEKMLYVKDCSDGIPNPMVVKSISITDSFGRTNYPVKVTDSMRISMLVNNTGPTIEKLLSNSQLQIYGRLLWGQCSWFSLPTFGLLSNVEKCIGCPLQPGLIKVTLRIDPQKYAPIVKLLAEGVAYAIRVETRDGQRPNRQVACVRVEGTVQK